LSLIRDKGAEILCGTTLVPEKSGTYLRGIGRKSAQPNGKSFGALLKGDMTESCLLPCTNRQLSESRGIAHLSSS
jgi:hypothetical protein